MPIPVPGQLATVRQRRWVVTDTFPSLVRPGDLTPPVHRVVLQSVEDDGHGETLEVIWEVEPGATTYERDALPDPTRGFDSPARLEAFLDAVRWGAVHSVDLQQLHAPFRSGITLEDYQLDPVARALTMPRVNLLVADDVGLGKTIEAGLVAQELILRHRARTVLVVCPAGLQLQWRDQLRDKFGLEFRIVDSALMKDLRRRRGLHVNPWSHFPRLITSMDFLKRERPLRLFSETLQGAETRGILRRFDLLILDEAHNVAPSGRGEYAVDSQRTHAIRTIAPHFEHRLFLTATPHNGYPESFTALLEMLDDQRFARGVRPDPLQLRSVMIRRLKRDLPPDDLGRPRFPARHLEALEVDFDADERAVHTDLRDYSRLRLDGARDATERFASEFVLKLLKKRLFSSPEAFLHTLEAHLESVREGRARTASLDSRPTVRLLEREVDATLEDSDLDDEAEQRLEEAMAVTTRVFRPLSPDEERLTTRMRDWARRTVAVPDSRAKALLEWLDRTVRPGGVWNDTRVILFTEYRATQRWLARLLEARGFAGADRLSLIYGGMPTDEREAIKAAFQAHPSESTVRILLATDAASEGIDLQNHCSRLVHLEIPWNPNRLEQRNGRVDRHGQRADRVSIYHFVGRGFDAGALEGRAPGDLEGDLEFLMRAARKVDQIREDLGTVGDVLAARVEEAMLGRRHTLGHPETEHDRSRAAREVLKFERALDQRLAQLRANLRDSREALHLEPDRVKAVVDVALALANLEPLRPDPTLPGAWIVPHLPGTWAPCADGLDHPHTHRRRSITFDDAMARGRDDVVLAHLNHRLVQMALRLLRAEVWTPEAKASLHRVSARLVDDRALDLPLLVAHARLVLTGRDGVRIHEELVDVALAAREGKLERLGVQETRSRLEAVHQAVRGEASEALRAILAERWEGWKKPVRQALEHRMRDRVKSLEARLQERAEREVGDLVHVLDELERAIRQELTRDREPGQLMLWSTPEREQLERNRQALEARLEALDGERERESSAILARYDSPQPRLFPVALTWWVPRRFEAGGRA